MKISKVKVKNYRALKNFSIDWQDELSLIIGKNNCGKTSFLSIMSCFFSEGKSNNIRYDDFNFDFKKRLADCIVSGKNTIKDTEGIELYLYIEYSDEDNISNISPLLMDLVPSNHMVVLKIEYILDSVKMLQDGFEEYYDKLSFGRKTQKRKLDLFNRFMRDKSGKYFKTIYKAIKYDPVLQECNEKEYTVLDKSSFHLSRIISIKYIGAKRDTDNKENDTSLSSLSNRYYDRVKGAAGETILNEFEAQLLKTDVELTGLYDKLFEDIIGKVKKFGGTKDNETVIQIASSLGQQELIKGNTTMIYRNDEHELPENYNGLGYLNLISIIIQIEIMMAEFRCDNEREKIPSDLNILFIEEPEAHTHPQLQYVFIKNIKELLKSGKQCKDGSSINIQTLITSHSSHIVSECDFDDIKYFCRISPSEIVSRNLCSLEAEYKDDNDPDNKRFKFLKQYLTLNYAEVFFADKVILYEGDTERILLPAMMRKIDQEESYEGIPLLSQNISLIAAGANSQIFSQFLAFLDIKTLIITDIDAVKETKKLDKNSKARITYTECEVKKGNRTSNNALKFYFSNSLSTWGRTPLNFFVTRNASQKTLKYVQGEWKIDKEGMLRIAYQIEETVNGASYYPRSFEDAFFYCNRQFLIDNLENFRCFKNDEYIAKKDSSTGDYTYSAYDLAKKCIKSKPAFPLDVLLNSVKSTASDYSNWIIPPYIKEGLLWLREN